MKKYLITDPKFYGNEDLIFEKNLTKVLQKNEIDFICFRDKTSKNIEEIAKIFLQISNSFNIKYIAINSHINLAYKLGFNTIHLNSSQLKNIENLNKDFTTIASTHNEEEIKLAKDANFITYSPIFTTPNKGTPKTQKNLSEIVEKYNEKKIFALGGIISQNEVEICKKTECFGFASIRYFV